MPGEVVTIRINPRDCMAVADMIKSIGMHVDGMAFSQAAAIVFSSLLQAMREAGAIPNRDGFEYTELMQPFAVKTRTSKKLAVNKILTFMRSDHVIPAAVSVSSVMADPIRARIERRQRELLQKKVADEFNFTEGDLSEFQDCNAMLAGDIPLDVGKLRS